MLGFRKQESAEELAIRLHAEDTERLQQSQAELEAFQEIGIPSEYLERARKQIADQNARENTNRLRTAVARVAVIFAVALGILIFRPPAPAEPIRLTSPSVYALDVSPGTNAEFSSNVLTVNKFGTGKEYFATLRANSQPIGTTGLTNVKVIARGSLPAFRIRIISGRDSFVTSPFTLKNEWQTFQIRLDQLSHNRPGTAGFERVGIGRPDRIDIIQVQTGMYVNPQDASGTLEIERLEID
jgi:hypothetical protein